MENLDLDRFLKSCPLFAFGLALRRCGSNASWNLFYARLCLCLCPCVYVCLCRYVILPLCYVAVMLFCRYVIVPLCYCAVIILLRRFGYVVLLLCLRTTLYKRGPSHLALFSSLLHAATYSLPRPYTSTVSIYTPVLLNIHTLSLYLYLYLVPSCSPGSARSDGPIRSISVCRQLP